MQPITHFMQPITHWGLPLLSGLLLAGCAEEPPGDLRAVQSSLGLGVVDTVKARLLEREAAREGNATYHWGRLNGNERAWLQDRGYQLVRQRIDSTATHYFRRQAERHPRWSGQTLMTERTFARSANRDRAGWVSKAYATESKPRLDPTDLPAPDSDRLSRPEPSSSTGTPKASRRATAEGATFSSPSELSETASAERPDGGRWGIVVGSMADSISALALRRRYEERLSGGDFPVHLQTGLKSGELRHRVVVGRFDSTGARRALEGLGSQLPSGAWVLSFPSDTSPRDASAE